MKLPVLVTSFASLILALDRCIFIDVFVIYLKTEFYNVILNSTSILKKIVFLKIYVFIFCKCFFLYIMKNCKKKNIGNSETFFSCKILRLLFTFFFFYLFDIFIFENWRCERTLYEISMKTSF